MANWSDIELLLLRGLSEFLAEKLPVIGGEQWWRNHVVGQLTPSQLMVTENLADGNLRGLDLAALLRVCERNWSELAYRFGLDKSGQEVVNRLRDARNRHAHRSVDGVPRVEVLADMDVASQLLKTIEADFETIVRCNEIRDAFQAASSDALVVEDPKRAIVSGGGTADEAVDPATDLAASDTSNGSWLVEPASHANDLETVLTDTTYVGIDFGTSTTVASFAHMSPQRLLTADTLKLAQPDRYGGVIRDHLVNSVLAVCKGDKILFGHDAHRMRPSLADGQSVFTSFKMHLGVEIGPTYPNTKLRQDVGPIVVESARDATTEFFRFLNSAISEALEGRGLKPVVKFAISVPASFEANQRRALLGCAKNAGLSIDSSCLIDEPNAAFLSFMNACIHQEQDTELADIMKERGLNILVYDFGAGTCDVSVLHVALPGGKVRSKNLAISKFAALGGDDIDRAIAKEVLVPQLQKANPGIALTATQVDRNLVPRLMPTAERLKIGINKWLTERRVETLEDVISFDELFSDQAFSYTVSNRKDERGCAVKDRLTLATPTLSTTDFARVLRPFMGKFNELRPGPHVFAPVDDALSKSGLSPFDLDAVLFIGGSAKSPVVRECIMRHLPDAVRPLVPTDLQSHVSAGAALHSLGYHGFGFNFVAPITSEPILVITRDGGMQTIVPASASVPSEEPFSLSLTIDRDDQLTIELPICVSSEAKLLGLLRLDAPNGNSFARGLQIDVEASMTEDKLLVIRASAGGVSVSSSLLDPLANRELSQTERRLLEARQQYNIACLNGGGRPEREDVLIYAYAAQTAGDHLLAADLFVQIDRSGRAKDHATNIGYSYGRAGQRELARKWTRIAYERQPCALTAYNMSCYADRDEQARYLKEALQHDPFYNCALVSMGALLKAKGESDGERMLRSAIESLTRDLNDNCIYASDCTWLVKAADLLGNSALSSRSKARRDTLRGDDSRAYDNENLADDPLATNQMVGR